MNGGAEAYSSPVALQALVQTLGCSVAQSLATATEAPLRAAVGALGGVLTTHSGLLFALQTQLQVGLSFAECSVIASRKELLGRGM